jgi:hypothetical protein
MGGVQINLYSHLADCLYVPDADQKKHPVSIVQIVQVDQFVLKSRGADLKEIID